MPCYAMHCIAMEAETAPLRVLAVANHKGGVGKTATAHALGTVLHARGLRVLLAYP